jgi:anti-sigma factor RsiW
MENKVLGYLDGRLKESERLEMEKHLELCAGCRLRVTEFRAVSGLLDELPMIEPSPAFDARVHALVAAEPAKQSWWAWMIPAPRVALAASMLLLGTVWISSHSGNSGAAQIEAQDAPVLENYDVISNFEPLTELSQPVQAEEDNQ